MSIRLIYFLSVIIISCLLATSIYLQVAEGILPCPLCTLQRLAFVLLGIIFLLGIFFHAKKWQRLLINSISFLVSLSGIILAGRQVWLQQFPSMEHGECGVSLHYMLQVLPLNEVMGKVFAGSSECSQRGFEFLSLNMAEWALIWFSLFLLLTGYLFLKECKRK